MADFSDMDKHRAGQEKAGGDRWYVTDFELRDLAENLRRRGEAEWATKIKAMQEQFLIIWGDWLKEPRPT